MSTTYIVLYYVPTWEPPTAANQRAEHTKGSHLFKVPTQLHLLYEEVSSTITVALYSRLSIV
jgi:hypothetical protein